MAKQTSTQRIVSKHFEEFRLDGRSEWPEDDVFELFVSNLVLKTKQLGDDELAEGIVDGHNDGGNDSIFIFLNGILIDDPDEISCNKDAIKKRAGEKPKIELFIIQSKNRFQWEEGPIEKFESNLPLLLELEPNEQELESEFNERVREKLNIFRKLALTLETAFPTTHIEIIYASRATEANIKDAMRRKARNLKSKLAEDKSPDTTVNVSLYGAEKLYDLIKDPVTITATLKLKTTPISDGDAYLGLASVGDYLKFVRRDGALLREMMAANVRDYEGDNNVNSDIAETLATDGGAHFWWRNNGINILANKVQYKSNSLTMQQPLIVNGLQTTTVLHNTEEGGNLKSSRLDEGVVVRVIESNDEEIRNQVIVGTNNQTKITGFSLYASDETQHNIEDYFLTADWYYERRKNFYKNQSKPAARRVEMRTLVQAILTLKLGQPDVARARPLTALHKNYEEIFVKGLDPEVYLKAAQLMSAYNNFLRSSNGKKIAPSSSNVKFYFLLLSSIRQLNIDDPSKLNFVHNHKRLKVENLDTSTLEADLRYVCELFDSYEKNHPGETQDSIAKSSKFKEDVFRKLKYNSQRNSKLKAQGKRPR